MLTLIPTPIGNLGDITTRALEVLGQSQLILCEDTRVTKKLLHLISLKFNITFENKEFKSIHSHNEQEFLTQDTKQLLSSKNVAYLSDAGMPCISDPGARLVDFCIKNDIKYDVLPGANAPLTAFAMSGFLQKEFIFFGFLPHKDKNREDYIIQICKNIYPTIIYESPKRLLKLLNEIEKIDNTKEIFAVKEMTKLHQQSFKGDIKTINNKLKTTTIKGEWVVIVDGLNTPQGKNLTTSDIKDLSLPPKQKAKLLAKLTGKNIKDIYNNLI
jgi:16S rRNA (cytidine1402-2'-O)-methyltransferase